ncbi:DUF3316 domain-containing protein [Reinekea marinisedimentorum]|uniref:Uncharacterized protein DUF3316 n=1 Tax=Reinekea marinisedimentorum TaxID=230495 RepID=A0A4R3I8E2_9GAMM|nr:DUF3316 domain-containing protein [Reinekea marinisedimentorum]TCS40467.1 uncharacterized protein DUF3316 [Reinekea marinisedimentorum]
MKIINLLTTAMTTVVLISAASIASANTEYTSKSFYSDSYTTEAEAYNAGFDVVDNVTQASKGELNKMLDTYGFSRDLTVDDAKVTLEEFAVERGQIEYRAKVSVNYHYEVDNND